MKLTKSLRWIISSVIIVFLIMFARTIDWRAAWDSMRHASLPLLALAIACVNIASVIIKEFGGGCSFGPRGIKSLP